MITVYWIKNNEIIINKYNRYIIGQIVSLTDQLENRFSMYRGQSG